MPDPTREQFDAAAKKVMASAPAGLSHDQFFALVDKELGADDPPSAKLAPVDGRLAFRDPHPEQDEHEPDTFGAGFIKGLKREFDATSAPGAKGMAHPQSAGDFASLLLPSGLGMGRGGLSYLKELAKRSVGALGEAGTETKTLKDVATFPVRSWGKFADELKRDSLGVETAQDTLKRLSTAAPAGTSKAVEHVPYATPTPKAPTPTAATPRHVGKAPTVNEELQKALDEAMGMAETPEMSSMSPEPRPLAEGSFKQSWPKSKQQNLGGYSVGGNAGSDREAYDSIMRRLGKEPLPDEMFPPRSGEPVGAGDVELASEPVSSGGSASPAPNKPKMTAAEVAAALRREYGSRDAGSMLYGNSISPAERAEAVKRLAPGPSQVPLAAERRIEEAQRRARGLPEDDDLLSILTALMAGGGATALSSRTTVPLSSEP